MKMTSKQNRGFSLLQTMIAAGLIGGLALVLAQLTGNMGQTQRNAHAKADEFELKTSIRLLLNDNRHCRVSLAGDGPLGAPSVPVVFEKQNIDEDSEGLPIALYLSNQAGDARSRKKFNGRDNNPGGADLSRYGRLTIKTIKLIMNSSVGANYADSPAHNDIGVIRVVAEKKIDKVQTQDITLDFDVNVNMRTGQAPEASGETRITSCSSAVSLTSSGTALSVVEHDLRAAPFLEATITRDKLYWVEMKLSIGGGQNCDYAYDIDIRNNGVVVASLKNADTGDTDGIGNKDKTKTTVFKLNSGSVVDIDYVESEDVHSGFCSISLDALKLFTQ